MFLRNLKWNFIVSIVFYSSMALAHFDLSAGLQGRTFPALGLLATVDSGYNWVIWDERTGENDKWKFGLIRPYMNGGTSIVLNQIGAGVDIYPISLISFGVGRLYDESNFDFNYFDCNLIACQNRYQRDYTRFKILFGLKGFVFFSIFQKENIIPSEKQKNFGEYTHVIEGNKDREQLETLQSFLGYQIDKKNTLGLLYLHAETKRQQQSSDGYYLVLQKPLWGIKSNIGAGAFRSSIHGEGVGIIFRFQKDFLPSEKLL